MNKTKKTRISLKEVRDLKAGATIWDSQVTGFCARRRKGSSVFYGLKYRTSEGRQRWYSIGKHGAPWTPDSARGEARRLLSEVFRGNDPAADKLSKRRAASVGELCELYLEAASQGRVLTRGGRVKKKSTLKTDQSRIEAHIKPLLGSRKISELGRQDIEKFMHEIARGASSRRLHLGMPRAVSIVRGGRGAASRTIGLLGAIFGFAVRSGMRADNPVAGVRRFADGRRDRRLSDAEYGKLGVGLGSSNHLWPYAVSATWFLVLTGWRLGEVLSLRWNDVDLQKRLARLPETKTGASVRPLSSAAVRVLVSLSRAGDLVFPSTREGRVMSGYPSFFKQIRRGGDLSKEITPHVLRHSFASVAADLEYSELTIGALIGHRGGSITSRYTHRADPVLLAAADTIAARIVHLMEAETVDGSKSPPTSTSMQMPTAHLRVA